MYARTGRPSIPPERLLRALLLQELYAVRSERLLVNDRLAIVTSSCVSMRQGGMCHRDRGFLRGQSRRRKDPIMNEPITYVGIDAHKKDDRDAERRQRPPTRAGAVRRLVRKLERATIRACYEAGPCGYALTTTRVACAVCAGDPPQAGRAQDDSARCAEAGRITEVRPPTPADERS